MFDAVILGLIEGLTEFLPVSSTGHLIVTSRLLDTANATFEVAIQVGAITAILVLYWRDLLRSFRALFGGVAVDAQPAPRCNMLYLLVVAAIPAAVLGLLMDDWLEAKLFNPTVVAMTMVLGGVLLWWLEIWLAGKTPSEAAENQATSDKPAASNSLELPAMSIRQALVVGVFQCLALVPGTSRSGATIGGAMVLGFTRTAAAEFSFLVGLPILYGACTLKVMKNWEEVTGPLLPALLVATGVSFVAALAVVVPFVRFLRKHTFVPFAIYRILAGLVLFALIYFKVV